MKTYVAALTALLLCVFPDVAAHAQTQRALLIGINTYQPEGTVAQHPVGCTDGRCALPQFNNLAGAVNDAQAMADLLTSPKFAFPPNRVVLLTNPAPSHRRPGVVVLSAAETSRDGILAAMQKYLVDVPQRDDTVVFYIASHGSLRINSKGSKLNVLTNGKYVPVDSTVVASDAYTGNYDIRDREMARIFHAALDKGIHLTVILDSCHSGGLSRGLETKYHARVLPFDPRDIHEGPDLLPNGQPRPAPTKRDDNPALVFSAAQQDQSANEPKPGTTTEPHGIFTSALIEALTVLPASTPAAIVYQRVRAVIEGGDFPPQDPDLDASAARRQQPLFGGSGTTSGKVHAAALMTDEEGNVWLDIGSVSGIGAGSEFTSITSIGDKPATRLSISDLRGISRSVATVVSPAGATVASGEIFELTKWVPAESAPLLVWHWPSNLSEDDIQSASSAIRAANITTAVDPAEEQWTHILEWDGTNWVLHAANASTTVSLGAHLTTSELRQHLPAGTKLWANLPPSRDLAAKIVPADPASTVQTSPDLDSAHYILSGTLTADGPAYAWFHKSDFAAGPLKSVTKDHTPGCSTTSPYPMRSKWVAAHSSDSNDDAAKKLNMYASRLGKINDWLQLADSPGDASGADYYALHMVRSLDLSPIPEDVSLMQGDQIEMALHSDHPVTQQRWVYIFDIDCQGDGTLLYPSDYSENQFPKSKAYVPDVILPDSKMCVAHPYGLDTYVLLSTQEPLTDPSVLNFEGVAEHGTKGVKTPLESLLADTSGGLRRGQKPILTGWGISLMPIRSVQVDPSKPACRDADGNPVY
jgi:hypothetical protein